MYFGDGSGAQLFSGPTLAYLEKPQQQLVCFADHVGKFNRECERFLLTSSALGPEEPPNISRLSRNVGLRRFSAEICASGTFG